MLVEIRLVLRTNSSNIKDIETAIVNALYDTATIQAVIDMDTRKWADHDQSAETIKQLQRSLDQRLEAEGPETPTTTTPRT